MRRFRGAESFPGLAPGTHPQNVLWISAAQCLYGCRHSQLGFLQTFRASGLLSAEHPRLSCRPADAHCTILSITPSPQLTEHWRNHDRSLKMFQSLQKETLKQSFENKRAKSMIFFCLFFMSDKLEQIWFNHSKQDLFWKKRQSGPLTRCSLLAWDRI